MPADCYDLIYFNAPGRAEAIRLMFYAAGIDFNDKRCGSKEWSKLKESMPLGAIPVLKINGVPYSQSTSLARYAAKLANYYPDDPVEALAVDEAMESMNELLTLFPFTFDTESEEEKKRVRQDFQKTVMTKYAEYAEKKIQLAGGKSFASTPNVADVWLMVQAEVLSTGILDYIDMDFYNQETYPGIMATCEAIKETLMANEKVAAFMEASEFWK